MRELKWWKAIPVALLLVASTPGCQSPIGAACVCSQDFIFLIVTVHDSTGQPVTDVTITVTQLRTGQTLAVQQGVPTAGIYVILDDTFRSQISQSGETIRVVGQKGSASFSADFVVATDSCGCHVSKISGPGIVTL